MRLRTLFLPVLVGFVFALGLAFCLVSGCGQSAETGIVNDLRGGMDPASLSESVDGLAGVDVRFMARGYCVAGSRKEGANDPGGFGPSDNLSQPYPLAEDPLDAGLHVIARTDLPVPAGDNQGFLLLLVNATDREIELPASDSLIELLCEARDAEGEWRPIEYVPDTWCGNSYHHIYLEPGYYWTFKAPVYHGEVETELRYALTNVEGGPVYSNVFAGSINPEQFEVKQGDTPSDLMDPDDE